MLRGMYLVHALLRPSGHPVPAGFAAFVSDCAEPDDQLDHAELHPDAEGGPVLGLFVTAPSMAAAEGTARALVERALKRHPALDEGVLVRCEVPFTPPFYEWLAVLPDEGGRLMPGRFRPVETDDKPDPGREK
jgi:hypothetical protein